MPTTLNYEWVLPEQGGSAGTWGTELNENVFDEIDADLQVVADAAAAAAATAGTALPKAGGVLTGEVEFKTTRSAVASLGSISGTLTLNQDTADVFHGTAAGNITNFAISNATSGRMAVVVLELTNGGAVSVNWGSAVRWDSGAAPALRTSGVDVLVFWTRDGGTTIYASRALTWAA